MSGGDEKVLACTTVSRRRYLRLNNILVDGDHRPITFRFSNSQILSRKEFAGSVEEVALSARRL